MNENPHRDETALLREYAGLARVYDTRWSMYVGATVDETITRLKPRAPERILDVGCGTGALLAALAAVTPGLSLSGVDPSPEMLAIAKSRLEGRAVLCEAWAKQLPFGDGGFDAVVSSSVFHYFRDPGRALGEIRRVLAPGGRLVITDWCHEYLSCRVCGLYLRITRKRFARIYRSAELRRMLEAAGFTAVRVERYKVDWLWGLMTATAARPLT